MFRLLSSYILVNKLPRYSSVNVILINPGPAIFKLVNLLSFSSSFTISSAITLGDFL